MELYALDRGFKRQVVIDNFISAIWTERYYGDDNFEIVVPPTQSLSEALAPGTLMEEASSDIPMIVEDATIEEGVLKVTGISLTQWLNNRFIRSSAYPNDDSWEPDPPTSPGALIAKMINYWATGVGSPYLVDPSVDAFGHLLGDPATIMGMRYPTHLKIPGLTVIAYDDTLPVVEDVSIPYGPLYDAVRDIATAYSIGLKIKLESVTASTYSLGFYAYLGVDRTSGQTVNPVVRFSPLDNSLSNIKRLDSLSNTKTLLFGYAPNVDDDASTYYTTPEYIDLIALTGFDIRAEMRSYDEITQDMVVDAGGPIDQGLVYKSLLVQKLYQEWKRHGKLISLIDGDIGNSRFVYGTHYNLGDTIEMEAFENIVSKAIVTEFIRSQDSAGERVFPTVALVE